MTQVADLSVIAGVEFYDRRKFASQAHGPHREWPVFDRPIGKVTGVCLHQTACFMGERPERYDGTGAHFVVTRAGKVVWLHDFHREVAAANGWNNGCVSIEIDGLYAGVDGDPSTVWDDPTTPFHEQGMALTTEAITAVLALVTWIKQQLPQLRVIVAHRQASSSRRDDPGSAIWKSCALPLHASLGCTDGGIGFKLDDGYPIPEAWDPRCVGIKY